jgi:AcrR family transcriptional regulator
VTAHRSTEERRAQILEAARACFAERGYHATRMQEIAAACGLSKGALYFHFDNKRALLDALLDLELERATRIFDAAAGADDPLAAVFLAFTGFLGDLDDARHRLFLLTGELAMQDDSLRARLLADHLAHVERLAALLEQAASRLGADVADPRPLATLLKATADGLQGAAALGAPVDSSRLLGAALALVRRPAPG